MKVFVFVFLFSFISCSSNQYSKPIDSDLNVVDLDSKNSKLNAPDIRNDDGSKLIVGPEAPNVVGLTTKKETKKVWAVVLSPGLNRVICQAVALRALKEKDISFNIVTGMGMGAIVASYFAMGLTPEVIEWKFHKFFKSIKKERPFSEEWLAIIKNVLLKDFKGKNIQSTKLTLTIPVFNKIEGKVEYVKRGDLYARLIDSLNLSKSSEDKFSTVLEAGDIDISDLRKTGAEKIVFINTIPGKIKFEGKEDYLFGVFAKLNSNLRNIKADYILNLPVDELSLDEKEHFPAFLRMSYLFTRDNSAEISEDYSEGKKLD